MTRDDVEDLFDAVTGSNIGYGDKSEGRAMYLSSDEVMEFARKIAAHEREACAKLCDKLGDQFADTNAADCAEAIRARGQG